MSYENKWLGGCFYSTLIASFMRSLAKSCGVYNYELLLRAWLAQYEELSEENINEIIRLACDGRLEFEENCKSFLAEHRDDNRDDLRKIAFK